ncbi:MAG: hypothetical protein ABGY41_11830, partial [Candidatus Poribacteria bacterium]
APTSQIARYQDREATRARPRTPAAAGVHGDRRITGLPTMADESVEAHGSARMVPRNAVPNFGQEA